MHAGRYQRRLSGGGRDTGNLSRPAADLERLAGYYDTHDTSTEMEHGERVEPQPMATTSLRLPAEVIDELKRQARAGTSATPATSGQSWNMLPRAARRRIWLRSPSGLSELNGPSPAGMPKTIRRQPDTGPAYTSIDLAPKPLYEQEGPPAYWDRAPARTLALLTESFTQMAAQGELDTDDPAAAAALFAYAVLGLHQDQALLQPSRPLARADLDEHVEKIVTAFLRAYAPIAHPQAVSR